MCTLDYDYYAQCEHHRYVRRNFCEKPNGAECDILRPFTKTQWTRDGICLACEKSIRREAERMEDHGVLQTAANNQGAIVDVFEGSLHSDDEGEEEDEESDDNHERSEGEEDSNEEKGEQIDEGSRYAERQQLPFMQIADAQ